MQMSHNAMFEKPNGTLRRTGFFFWKLSGNVFGRWERDVVDHDVSSNSSRHDKKSNNSDRLESR